MRAIKFESNAFTEYLDWRKMNTQMFDKINELIKEISRDPFQGKGKPEPLKGNWKGYWSRRFNDEHRLIYKADADTVYIAKCRGHYQ
ncbi:MAG TPA: Txe/YoeB family addiction module toxin [Chitinophagales bacterium]|nr:Txe/YoeB family addiction module toxin [Chitinophagales bacterium]